MNCPDCTFPAEVNVATGQYDCPRCHLTFQPCEIDHTEAPEVLEASTCALCEQAFGHTPGCPNDGPTDGTCIECGEDVPLAELAAHFISAHGMSAEDATEMQEMIEQRLADARQQISWAQARAETEALRPRSARDAYQMSTDFILAAIGHNTATGRWPEDFDVDGALLVMTDRYLEARSRVVAHHKLNENEGMQHGEPCEICSQVIRGEA